MRSQWGRMASCAAIGNRRACRLPTGTQLAKLSRMGLRPTEVHENPFDRRRAVGTVDSGAGLGYSPYAGVGFRPCPTKGQLHAVAVLARDACLRHYGRSCAACGFNFEANYGEATAGYIHVHHVIPMAQVGTEYELHPIRDLRPVCPNCHAVIHRREPPFSIEEIKHMLQNHGAKGSPEGVRDVRRRTRMPNKGSAADACG